MAIFLRYLQKPSCTLVRLLRLTVWPQEVAWFTNGKERNIPHQLVLILTLTCLVIVVLKSTCTLLCGILVLHISSIFYFFPCLHELLGTARLLTLLINSYLHVYLELKIHCFRGKFVNFTWYMTTIRPINMFNSLLQTIT